MELKEDLYVKVMKRIVSEHPFYTSDQVIVSAAQDLYREFISENDRKVMELAFCQKINQKDLDKFLSDWDIETMGVNKAAILAYTMKMHPKLKFDDYTGPRLKGLLNYLRFKNLELISHFSKIVRKLNQENIVPVVIKGGAMRYLRSDMPRIMGDIDILLHTQDELNTTKKIIQKMGYVCMNAGHSFDVHLADNIEKGILDVHKFFSFLPDLNKKFNRALFSRTQRHKVFSVDAFLPSAEDMVFICLNNLTLNLKNGSSIDNIPYAVFDIEYLINSKNDFDWDILAEDISMTHTEATSYLGMLFINQIVSDIFPEQLLANPKISKEVENFINHDKFYSLYVHDVKMACKKLRLMKAIRHWSTFKNYLRLEGQHFFTKRILKHPSLIRLFLKRRAKHAN